MLFLRIRQAEVALAGGRLDEAYDLATRPDVRSHCKGQELIGRVTHALLARGARWMEMDRPADAAADADRVIRLAGQLPEAVELKARAAAAMLAEHERRRRSAGVLARARQHLHRGQLAVAEQVVRRGDLSTGGLQVIMEDLHEQQQRVTDALASAESALSRGDYEQVIADLAAVRSLDSTNPQFVELTARTHRGLLEQASETLRSGRLDMAALIEHRLAKLGHNAMEVEQFRQTLAHLRHAWEAIERGQLRRAEETLRRLGGGSLSGVGWLSEAVERLQLAASAIEGLRTGPIGLLGSAGLAAARVPIGGSGMNETLPPPAAKASSPRSAATPPPLPRRGAVIGNRFLVQVDGAGSFLVVRDSAVSIGPISASSRVHVGLICEPNTPAITVERVEDDYFLRAGIPGRPADGGVLVNDAVATSRLLNSGDRLALSPRCRLLFATPCPASTTATLDLTGARYPRGDVRRVVLMDGDLVLAPGGASHVRVDSLSEPVVLVQRDGQLFLRGGVAVTMGDQPIDGNTPVQPGLPVRGAGFGFVITPL